MDPNTICVYNISQLPLNPTQQNLCEIYVVIMQNFNNYANFVIAFLCLIIILCTLMGNIKENFKWFVFHYALLYFVFYTTNIIFDRLFYIFNSEAFNIFMNYLHIYFLNHLHDLALVTGVPLAFNRFFQMYFPTHYEKFFNKKALLWCFGYDALVVLLSNVLSWASQLLFPNQYQLVSNLARIVLNIILMFSMILLTVFIFMKIRKNLKLLKDNIAQKNTLKEIRRAALACLIQAIIVLINMLLTIFGEVFQAKRDSDPNFTYEFVSLFILVVPLGDMIYACAVIIDDLIFLLVLKSYRNVLMNVYKKVMKKRANFKSTTTPATTTVRAFESRATRRNTVN